MMYMQTRRRVRHAVVALACLIAVAAVTLVAQTAIDNNNGADFAPKAPVLAQSAAEEAKSFVMPPGYRMELVLSDPDIINPAIIEFDGNGRMYVAEFMSYMNDVDGSTNHDATNRISRWESTKGDGVYDKHTVFVDHLMIPRMILPLTDGSILTNETDSDDVIKWTDTNGDGVADKRELFYQGVGLNRDGNLEHEQSGFIWGLDNWIYSTYNAFRFRWTPSGIMREPTGNNGGQWGLSQDDDGKMWFVCAGCEQGPLNFQIPIQYGALRVRPTQARGGPPPAADAFDEYEPGYETVWPIAGVGDMQGGMGRVRMPIGTLNHTTATAGPDIVRGDRVPADLKGDLLYVEPVGRLIRRTKIVKTEGLTQLKNAYPGSEFILSRDLLFRPVNLRTAPDGTVYVADMYRGIIQEAQWTGPGSYLRLKIQQYQMDKVINHGRIWRLRFDGVAEVPATPQGAAARPTPAIPAVPAIPLDLTPPRMYSETPAQLVAHLSHPNGWWRDTAQELLVLKQDKSVVPALQNLVRTPDNLVARFHALWTLEGLGALDAGLVRQAMKDPSPRMRIQAIRASETLYKTGDKSFAEDYRAATKDSDVDVAIQGMLSLNVLKIADAKDVITATMASNKAKGVQAIGAFLNTPAPTFGAGGRGGAGLTPEQQDLMQRGQTIYQELCYSCHGDDGHGAPLAGGAPGATMAPPLAGSAHVQGHRDFVIKTVLYGLTGQNNGKSYSEVMIPMGVQKDDWIAAVGSFIRNNFGNSAGFITPADVARVRAANATRKTSWNVDELASSLPTLLEAGSTWKLTASHNTERAANALSLAGWNTGTPAQTGMWFQIELPDAVNVTEVQYNAPAGRGGGAGGRGGAPGAPVPPGGAPAAAPAGAAAGGRAGVVPGQPAAGRGAAAAPAGPPTALMLQVQTSMDGKAWSAPVATGAAGTLTDLAFKPVRAKLVRLSTTAVPATAPAWTIQNLKVYQQPGPAVAPAK